MLLCTGLDNLTFTLMTNDFYKLFVHAQFEKVFQNIGLVPAGTGLRCSLKMQVLKSHRKTSIVACASGVRARAKGGKNRLRKKTSSFLIPSPNHAGEEL